MKRAAGITCLIGGLLLILVPRYFLPVCEFQGYQPMHCSDTARAEAFAGALLAAAGGATLLLRRPGPLAIALLASAGLAVTALMLPEIYGYCKSPKMPCNYGTVPVIRLIGLISAILPGIASWSVLKQLVRKDKS